jgi:hypothetical protein
MKIKFGTTSNNINRASFFACILVACTFVALGTRNVLDQSHESILRSPVTNVTSINEGFFCGIPYDDCLCSVQSKKNEFVKYCLTDNFLVGSRISILVSFVIQICLIRELFALSGKYARFFICVLWITSVFLFVIIANGIYRDSCFHRYISCFLYCTGALLFLPVFYDVFNSKDIDRSPRNNYNNFSDSELEEIDDDPIFWRDLL